MNHFVMRRFAYPFATEATLYTLLRTSLFVASDISAPPPICTEESVYVPTHNSILPSLPLPTPIHAGVFGVDVGQSCRRWLKCPASEDQPHSLPNVS